jgi:hypothetical protein
MAHSPASSTPSRCTRTTASITELMVNRPRQISAGTRDAVVPSQKMIRWMGRFLKTSPVVRSVMSLRIRIAWRLAQSQALHFPQRKPEASTRGPRSSVERVVA